MVASTRQPPPEFLERSHGSSSEQSGLDIPGLFLFSCARQMAESLDQLFVSLKHGMVGLFPVSWQPFVSIFISIGRIIGVFAGLVVVVTVLERKGLGRIQNRYGPNRVGPYGFLQFAADGIKALTKEDVVPRVADQIVHFLAPLALVVPVFLSYSVLPFGRNMVPIDIDGGV